MSNVITLNDNEARRAKLNNVARANKLAAQIAACSDKHAVAMLDTIAATYSAAFVAVVYQALDVLS